MDDIFDIILELENIALYANSHKLTRAELRTELSNFRDKHNLWRHKNINLMTQLNKQTYQQLIKEDIEQLNKFMPEHSLERKHIVDVLNWSVNQIYPDKPKPQQEIPKCRICESNQRVKFVEHGYKHCTNCGNHWL